jgi:hypothetical protein
VKYNPFLMAVDALLEDDVWYDVADKARKPEEFGDGPEQTLAKLRRVKELRRGM